jgi:putative ABC transport system permease protein
MFFASVSISGTMVKLQMDQWRQNYGYSDIIIQAGANSPSPYFYSNSAKKYRANAEYIVGEISGFGVCLQDGESTGISLRGIELEDLRLLTPLSFQDQAGLYPFKGSRIIISRTASDKLGLIAGDTMVLSVNGIRHKFTVGGIVQSSGPFANEGDTLRAVIPRETLCALYDARGRVDMVYIKSKNPPVKYKLIIKLSQEYGRYVVKEPFTEQEIKRQTDRITMPMIIVTVILSFMSVYVIYSTFRIIIMERLPVIGTFRSAGAAAGTANAVLLLESLIYGVVGGIAGYVLGVFVLKAMSGIMNPEAMDSYAAAFSPLQSVQTVAVAAAISLAGAAGPIFKAMRFPVKEIVLGTLQTGPSQNRQRIIPGILMTAVALLIPLHAKGSMAKWIDTLCVLVLMIAVILLLPIMIALFSRFFEAIYGIIAGNVGILAAKNLRENRSLLNSISLLVIGISGMYMVTTVNYGETRQIRDCFERSYYDIVMETGNTTKNLLNVILSQEGVQDICASYYAGAVAVKGQDDPIWHVEGIDTGKFPEYFRLVISSGNGGATDASGVMDLLDSGRYILLTATLRDRFGVSAGETIVLKVRSPSGLFIERPYIIAGFFENLFPGRWSYALVSQRYFGLDIGHGSYGPVYIKSEGDTEATVNQLQSVFGRRKPSVTTVSEIREEALESNRQLFLILQCFSAVTLAVGIVGTFNNLVIGFMQRKRSLAVIRSIGMSKFQLLVMVFLESAAGGILGGSVGAFTGVSVVSFIIPRLIKALEIETHIYHSDLILHVCILSGVIISMIASAGPAVRLLRLNLMNALKYE